MKRLQIRKNIIFFQYFTFLMQSFTYLNWEFLNTDLDCKLKLESMILKQDSGGQKQQIDFQIKECLLEFLTFFGYKGEVNTLAGLPPFKVFFYLINVRLIKNTFIWKVGQGSKCPIRKDSLGKEAYACCICYNYQPYTPGCIAVQIEQSPCFLAYRKHAWTSHLAIL